MKAEGVKAEVYGRPKHIYSIWRKMQKKNLAFDELFDVRAVRIVAERLQDCYAALGIVHTHYRHLPDEFDDYVANPKPNGYQSIHTVVLGPGGKTVEIQIRTKQMHEDAGGQKQSRFLLQDSVLSRHDSQSSARNSHYPSSFP